MSDQVDDATQLIEMINRPVLARPTDYIILGPQGLSPLQAMSGTDRLEKMESVLGIDPYHDEWASAHYDYRAGGWNVCGSSPAVISRLRQQLKPSMKP